MTAFAVGLPNVQSAATVPAKDVRLIRDRPEMIRIHTWTIVADVIHDKNSNRPVQMFIDPAARDVRLSVQAESAIPVVVSRTIPDPATLRDIHVGPESFQTFLQCTSSIRHSWPR